MLFCSIISNAVASTCLILAVLRNGLTFWVSDWKSLSAYSFQKVSLGLYVPSAI